jgi:polyhydroxyalkanoate synthase subunit PhaC
VSAPSSPSASPRAPLDAPLLAWSAAADEIAAAAARARLHLVAQTARALHGKPPIAFIAGAAHPFTCVADHPLARLLRYEPLGTRRAGSVVVVASLINKYYVLDLLPEISVLRGYQQRGFAVYVLDWKAPGASGPELGFAEYVDGAIAAAVDHAAAAEGGAPHLLGYCMGGTMAAMYAARRPTSIRSLTLLASPIDFHASGVLADWTRRERFDADLVVDALGNMPPWLMQSGFKLMNPIDQVMKPLRTLLDGADELRIRHVTALESWLDDNIAFPGKLYREYIKGLYQDNALVRGELAFGGQKVDLARITAPLLNVVAARDHIAAPPSSTVLQNLVGSTDREALTVDTGHIGLTASRGTLEKAWPKIWAWVEARA